MSARRRVRDAVRGLSQALVPAYRPAKPPSKQVAIVVPGFARDRLLPDELVSLRHLRTFLGHYDTYLMVPPDSRLELDGFRRLSYPAKFFGSPAAHNRLWFWPRYYEPFADYEYILVYHFDCLVFSDQLLHWCDVGYDYIGAPWMPCPEEPWITEPRVGNGGFTLIHVGAALQVLRNRYRLDPLAYCADVMLRHQRQLPSRLRQCGPLRRREATQDLFFSMQGPRCLPGYKVAPVDDGLRFAFETAPRTCFELNGGHLPFGCHAWTKYDRAFWEPFLLPGDQS